MWTLDTPRALCRSSIWNFANSSDVILCMRDASLLNSRSTEKFKSITMSSYNGGGDEVMMTMMTMRMEDFTFWNTEYILEQWPQF